LGGYHLQKSSDPINHFHIGEILYQYFAVSFINLKIFVFHVSVYLELTSEYIYFFNYLNVFKSLPLSFLSLLFLLSLTLSLSLHLSFQVSLPRPLWSPWPG